MDYETAARIVSFINKHIKGLYVVGSIRRREDINNDIDFITTKNLDVILDNFRKIFDDIDIKVEGDKYVDFKVGDIEINIWKANNKIEYNHMKILRTLDKGHTIGLRRMAKEKGMRLSEKGLYNFRTKNYTTFKTLGELKRMLK